MTGCLPKQDASAQESAEEAELRMAGEDLSSGMFLPGLIPSYARAWLQTTVRGG
jgi:hypothetical protein